MLNLKPRAVARALEVYLLVLVGGLVTAAAMLLLPPVLDRASAKRGAEASLPFQLGAGAITLERAPEPSVPPAATAISPPPSGASDRDNIAMALASLPEPPLAEAPANSLVPVEPPVASTDAAPSDSVEPRMAPEVPAAVITSRLAEEPLLAQPVPMVAQSSANTRRARDDAKRSSRSIAGYRVRAPRLGLPRRPAIPRTAGPLTRGSVGLGCPEGSDPRWSEPDATGTPALICNPYYRRVAVDVF